ncbi:SagB/ThcOx family dehydrogenase [Hyalangium rubrum]|uniref:SagB family peptide dehydrogenase n=1 Tax=Hyalangium rubrum TaxID=3103134 RepID=A0ABU5H7S9_9BACT|nr:SagB family peptide dehydrogenase [Hyalangium sp. s54d21]MDY7228944.1 SagB family peptide dehydrogenase [Hyalangium sp. s54d21]
MTPTTDGRRALQGRVQLVLPPVSTEVGAALDALCGGLHGADELTGLASRAGVADAATLQLLLKALGTHGALSRTLLSEGIPLATLTPATPRASGPGPGQGVRHTLSRFAFTRPVDGGTVLETPLSATRVWMPTWHGPALLGALATPRSSEELGALVPGISTEAVTVFLRMLAEAGVLTEAGPDGAPHESEALTTWEFHDLLFHSRSRWPPREGGTGATYRFRDRVPKPPEKKEPPSGEMLALPVPDLAEARRRDPPFTEVLERRRSIREHGPRRVTLAELGELLYRAVGERQAALQGGPVREARPYPAGGGLYESEVYVIAHQCEGLERGLYSYRPENHALYRMTGATPEVEQLLKGAVTGAALSESPQVLLVLTARFATVAWKYESMAYALMLKHVGVIFQTLYMVATAMGLAPCALGGGRADVFARASGLDPLVEGSVGEFLLGAPRDTSKS